MTAAEQQWIADRLRELADLGCAADDVASIARAYDEQLMAFLATDPAQRPDPNPIINALGVGIGAHLIVQAGPTARWVIATDPWGTDLAVHQVEGDLLVFPANALAKRWALGEVGAVEPLVDFLRQQMDSRRS